MKHFPFVHNFIFFLTLLISIRCFNGSVIHQFCGEAAKRDPQLSYDFCVACLGDLSISERVSIEDLANISMHLTKSNATNMVLKISELLKGQSGGYGKDCLRECSELYSDAISDTEDALRAFNSKDFEKANVMMSSAMDASVTCEDAFKDKKGEKSPLTKENKTYFQLTAMSLAFITMCSRST